MRKCALGPDQRAVRQHQLTVTLRPTEWLQNDTILNDSKFTSRGTCGVLSQLILGGPIATQYPSVPALFAQQQALGIRTIIPISVDPVSDGSSRSITNISLLKLGDDVTLKNIAAYHKERMILAADQDNTAFPYFNVYATPRDQTISQYTEELQLAGKSFGRRLDWVAGAFYQGQPTPSDYTVENLGVFGNYQYDLHREGLYSRAVYGHFIYDLSEVIPGFRINGGIRYSKDAFSTDVSNDGVGLCTGPPNGSRYEGGSETE